MNFVPGDLFTYYLYSISFASVICARVKKPTTAFLMASCVNGSILNAIYVKRVFITGPFALNDSCLLLLFGIHLF
jgi:hypothetical protein